ncbi:MAG: lipocalin-like domain-containing protein [Pseudomonadota bacterium]
MNARLLALFLLLWPFPAMAQGLYGMGSDPEGFRLPDPAVRFVFPDDHGSHPDFRIEWWYVTANLVAKDGTPMGMQWTLFRTATEPGDRSGWASPQIWFGHAGLTTPDAHFHAERFARGGIGQAGVTADPFAAWIDEWAMEGPTLSDVRLTAQGTDFAYDFRLTADRPYVPQGADGYSVKSEYGQASHYYSQPFYRLTGTVTLPSGSVTVTGTAWLDREWSSQPLAETQTGWDWISLHLDTGDKLMGYRLRDSAAEPFTFGTWIAADGTPDPLEAGELTMTPTRTAQVAGRDIPVAWRIELPDRDLALDLEALNDNSWMDVSFPYWEGPVTLAGTHGGVGYLEMTGYE